VVTVAPGTRVCGEWELLFVVAVVVVVVAVAAAAVEREHSKRPTTPGQSERTCSSIVVAVVEAGQPSQPASFSLSIERTLTMAQDGGSDGGDREKPLNFMSPSSSSFSSASFIDFFILVIFCAVLSTLDRS
jgi:hypothetical protein